MVRRDLDELVLFFGRALVDRDAIECVSFPAGLVVMLCLLDVVAQVLQAQQSQVQVLHAQQA